MRRPCWRRPLPPRSNWCARALAEIHQKESFAPIYHAQACRRERTCVARMTRKKTHEGERRQCRAWPKSSPSSTNDEAGAGRGDRRRCRSAAGGSAAARGAAVCRRRAARREDAGARGCPTASTSRTRWRALQAEYAPRGVNLVRIGKQMDVPHRRRSVLAADQARRSRRAKLSRAAIETLAIIAYHQPVTRAEIEDIRGVATSKGTLDVLLETGWIRPRGRRKAPGRPITYGTTETSCRISGWRRSAICRASTSSRAPACSTGVCRPALRFRCRPTTPTLRDDEDPLEPGDLDLGLGAAARSAASD